MARKLAYTVHVPVPDSAHYKVFNRGEELPEWAAPLVGDHVFVPGEGDDEEPESQEDDGPDQPDEDESQEDESEGEDQSEPPAGNASKDAWAEYAVATGADPDDVAAMSRNELRDRYGN